MMCTLTVHAVAGHHQWQRLRTTLVSIIRGEIAMVNRSGQQPSTEDQAGWMRPKLDELDLQFLMTRSVLGEFVDGHDSSDVLRELVQNEFDARGTRLDIAFGADSLRVRGNGIPIDAAGWKRLSVMLGQGQVAGSDRVIKPKANGIGSKNFGLKSLFLFGPQIFIRSAGLQTVLDYQRGAQSKPLPEPDSKRKPGVEIHVPYRTVADGHLVPFGFAEEENALDQFDQNLIPTLIKLVEPDSPKQLKQLVVTSDRHDRRVRWTQSAKKIDCSSRYVTAIQRTLRVERGPMEGPGPKSRHTIKEIEFQKSFDVPMEFQGTTFPRYFRVSSRRRIMIGISVKTKGKQIDLDHRGRLFYPIGVPNGQTGNGISINAPFEMDMNRSAILDGNPWNNWLLQCGANLTMDLLSVDWLERFGPDAYLAVYPNEKAAASSNEYCSAVTDRLSTDECWPTRAVPKGRRPRTVFNKANRVVIPDAEELDGFLRPERYLDPQFESNERIRQMVMRFGARRFTVNSLVRLRCAGKDIQHLATQLDESEARNYYGDLHNRWSDIALQQKFAHAIDVFERRLSTSNREDLKRAETTLNADGGLSAPNMPLWVVQGDIASAIKLSAAEQLHLDLCQYKVLPKLCEDFDIKSWVRKTAEEIRSKIASPEVRDALYAYVIERHGQFDQTTKAILRRAPILKTDRGDWATPESIIDIRARSAKDLQAVLNFPRLDYAQDVELAKALGFKKKVSGADLVAYARQVQQNPEMAESCANTLWKLRRLLDPKTVSQLSTVPFVSNTLGGLTSPLDTYLATDLNLVCLGPEAAFVKTEHRSLYEKLGCLSTPQSEDIVSYIARLQNSGEKPEDVKILYATLVQALRLEGEPTDSYEYEDILWAERCFHQPSEVLVGRGYREIFRGIIPQLPALSGYVKAARDLGAHSDPTPQHWRSLLRWFSNKWDGSDASKALPQTERNRLRHVYATLPTPPDGMSMNERFLLGTNGRLYSPAEAAEGILLINDDPQLAAELEACQSTVAFADTSIPGSLRFFTEASVQNLTEVRHWEGVHIGETVAARERINVDTALQKVQSDEFGSAFSRLVEYSVETGQVLLQPLELLAELKKRSNITFVDELQVAYVVAGHTVCVDQEIVLEDERFVSVRASNNEELQDRLSSALAGLVTEDPAIRRSLADSIFRLLASRSTKDMERYLKRRGIPWESNAGTGSEEWEDQSIESEIGQDEDDLYDSVTNMLGESIGSRTPTRLVQHDAQGVVTIHPTNGVQSDATRVSPTKPKTLPPLEEVTVKRIPREGTIHIRQPQQTRTSGGSSRWSPPTREQEEWNSTIGRRGEELVYLAELERVQKIGYPACRVQWVSDQNPGSDHDIRSVDCDGQDLWIEVKSTSGKDGRFQWSKNEFDLALSRKEQYVLYRVYEADSSYPSIKSFRNPVGLLLQNALHLDISSLNAEVESL